MKLGNTNEKERPFCSFKMVNCLFHIFFILMSSSPYLEAGSCMADSILSAENKRNTPS